MKKVRIRKNYKSLKHIIYDANGNKLSNGDLKNFKKVTMSLYKKSYFSKENGKVNIEIVRR